MSQEVWSGKESVSTMTECLPTKIISGGQTGADQAGLDFAIARGIEHGGWCPKGRRREGGVVPQNYHLQETPEWGYGPRTDLNTRDSHATIIFNAGRILSPGSALTLRCCEKHKRPFLLVKGFATGERFEAPAVNVLRFLAAHQPQTLNIAGNREESVPGISAYVEDVLSRAWALATHKTPQECLSLGTGRPIVKVETVTLVGEQQELLFAPSARPTRGRTH